MTIHSTRHCLSRQYRRRLITLLFYVYFQFDSQVIDLEGELVKAKRQNEDLRKNNKKTKVQAEKFQYQCEDLQTKLVSKC